MHCHLVARHYTFELCNAILLQRHYICEYAMPCCLANHHVCELYHAIIFLYYVFHLSTKFVYSTTLRVHRPFEAAMEVSGVKTRYSEQTTTCWSRHLAGYRELLRGGFRDLWAVMFPPWGLCSNLAGLYYPCHACCLALLNFYFIYGLPSANLLTI